MEMIEEPESVSFNKILRWSTLLIIFSFIVCVGNYIGYHHPLFEAFVGMIILSIISIIGLILERTLPFNVSSIIYISLIGLLISIPISPISGVVVYYVSHIELVSICTVFLAYVGIAVGNDWGKFKRMGWKGIIVTIFVILGTYLCSAFIAQGVLLYSGYI